MARQNCAREPVKVLPQFLKVVCESISVYPDETLDDCTGLNFNFLLSSISINATLLI